MRTCHDRMMRPGMRGFAQCLFLRFAELLACDGRDSIVCDSKRAPEGFIGCFVQQLVVQRLLLSRFFRVPVRKNSMILLSPARVGPAQNLGAVIAAEGPKDGYLSVVPRQANRRVIGRMVKLQTQDMLMHWVLSDVVVLNGYRERGPTCSTAPPMKQGRPEGQP